jgi:SAM-dependent methyltransferase
MDRRTLLKSDAQSHNPWNDDHPVSYAEMWIGAKECTRTIQRKISGDENTHWLPYVIDKYILPAISNENGIKRRETYRCLLLGSNEGYMERLLCERGFRGDIVASDIADKALARARQKAESLGYTNVTYVKADLNTDAFEGEFDFILAEGVLHHIVNIQQCLEMLAARLAPDGKLIMVEFEGPVRFQLPEHQMRWINAALRVLPKALRPFPQDAAGYLPASDAENSRVYYVIPSEKSIADFDPSEAICGPELKRLVPQLFSIVERKGFGGTLLSYMTGHFDFKRANDDEFANSWLKVLIGIEDTLIANGILDDDFVFYVLEKRQVNTP